MHNAALFLILYRHAVIHICDEERMLRYLVGVSVEGRYGEVSPLDYKEDG